MRELDDFLTQTLARQIEAEEALHKSDVTPRMEMWSTSDPVTLFGAAGPCMSGWDEVSRIFRWVTSRLSNCTVGYERCTASIDGGPAVQNTLRVTHVYRRENGGWKIVHRHGDVPPIDQSPAA